MPNTTASKKSAGFILGIALAAAVLFYIGLYYVQTTYDHWLQPWAYSSNASERLVGKWASQYTDPDGKQFALQLEFFVPKTAEERWKELLRRHRRRSVGSRSNTKAFDGIALVQHANTAADTLHIWGSLSEHAAPADINIHLAPIIDDNYPQGFQIQNLKGTWTGKQIDLNGTFTYHTPSGSGYSNSADPRFSYVANCTAVQQP